VAGGDTARLYHRLSSYGPSKGIPATPADHPLAVRDFVANDVETWPAPCKVYPHGLPLLELPRDWPSTEVPATAVLAGRPVAVVIPTPGETPT
jgi:hypothetical protein